MGCEQCRCVVLRSFPGVALPKGLEPSVLPRYQLIDRFSDRLFPLQRACFFATGWLETRGRAPTTAACLRDDNQALKFRRRGASDPQSRSLGVSVCPLHYSVACDNRGGSRTGWIRPHPLHFRLSCQERGGKDLIAALSDALKIEHVEMRAFQGSRSRGGWNPLHCLARGSRACGALRAGCVFSRRPLERPARQGHACLTLGATTVSSRLRFETPPAASSSRERQPRSSSPSPAL